MADLVDELAGRYVYIEELSRHGEVVSTGQGVVESAVEHGVAIAITLESNELDPRHLSFVGLINGRYLNITYLED